MGIEAHIYTRMSGFAGLTALVGTRISPNKLGQHTDLPAISYRRVASERPSNMAADIGIVRSRYQFDIWADSYDGMIAVKEQVIDCWQRYEGTQNSTEIIQAFIMLDMDMYEDESRVHHGIVDVEINYRE